MENVKIKMKLKSQNENYEKNVLGKYRGNKLRFLDDKVKVTVTLDDIVSIKRVSNEYEIVLNFKKDATLRGIYNLKKFNYNLPIDIKTNNMYIDSGQFLVDYELRCEDELMDNFTFALEYEVIE